MKQTLTEKILAKASGKQSAEVGDLVWTKVDVLMTHDPCSPGVIGIFKREFGENARVWDRERHILIPDHFIFTSDDKANANIRLMREFAKEQGLKYFYDVGTKDYKGVCHIALAEGGHNRPGEVLVGTDSHTVTSGAFGTFSIGVGNTDAAFILGTGESPLKVPPTIRVNLHNECKSHVMAKDIILKIIGDITVSGATYCAIEFGGEAVDLMGVADRMTICNMVVECGGKNGIMAPNQYTLDYVTQRTFIPFEALKPDSGAKYVRTLDYDLSTLEPLVAKPHSPDNVDTLDNVCGTKIDRAYIGSCTGGKLSDFVAAAKIIDGHKVVIDTYAVPATREVSEGIIHTKVNGRTVFDILKDAGVYVTFEAGCGACCGGPLDTFGRVNDAISVISTTNRNFPGRMGNKEALVYLASPYAVASTAITGKVINPVEFF